MIKDLGYVDATLLGEVSITQKGIYLFAHDGRFAYTHLVPSGDENIFNKLGLK